MKYQRGAVVVETALVIGIGLTLLLFSVQVGVLGFLQITADAASFVDAHQNVVGSLNTAGPEAATHAIFPEIATGDIAGVPQAAPSASVPVDYGYNSTNPAELAASNQNRHGGVSMLQPVLYSTTVTPHSYFTRLGKKLGVSGADVEPLWTECGAHHDVVNSNGGCGGSSSNPSNYQVNYFSQGENTPPFYVGFNYMEHCLDNQPWYANCSSSGTIGGTNFIALGMGEYLDTDNWSAGQPGASGTGVGVGVGAIAVAPNSTFEYAACHQRVYAQLAQFFAQYPDLTTIFNDYQPAITSDWVYNPQTDYRVWNEFDKTPGGVFVIPYIGPGTSSTDLLIKQVYSWDAQVQQGYAPSTYKEPGVYPLNPGGGC
jgi:hypothetical protein